MVEVESPRAELWSSRTPAGRGEGTPARREKFKNPSLRPRSQPWRAADAGAHAIWGTRFVGSREATSGSSHLCPGHRGRVRTLPALPSGRQCLLLPGAIFAPQPAGVPGGGPATGCRRPAVAEPRGGSGGRGPRPFGGRVPIPGGCVYAGAGTRSGASPGEGVRGSPRASARPRTGWGGEGGSGRLLTATLQAGGRKKHKSHFKRRSRAVGHSGHLRNINELQPPPTHKHNIYMCLQVRLSDFPL